MTRAVFLVLLAAACGPDPRIVDAPIGDPDARTDAAIDAGMVELIDAPAVDALDAAPPCQTTIQRFTMDGALDTSATVIAGGVTSIRIATAFSADGRLYVATDDAGEGSDHFVLVSAVAPGTATRGAPFGKLGTVAVGAGPTLFLADENDNDFESWFRLEAAGGDTLLSGPAYAAATATNGGVLEGTIDLVAVFGAVPAGVYVAAVPYATGDGGALVPAAQTPAGNGDGNIDAAEYVLFPIPCDATTTR